MRAGFVGIIVFASGFMLVRILTPFFRSIANRRHSSRHPEAAIVGGLLQLIAHLERLETLRQEREQLIHETLTRQKRRDDALRKLVEDEAQGKEPKEVKIKKFAVNTYLTDAYTFAVQQGDGSWKTVGRESTVVRRQDDDTFKESYNFGVQPKEGEWQVVMHEQRILPAFDLFREGDQWKGIRQQLARLVEELAWHIERGLPAKLSVGEQKLDTWLRQELRGRAETVRGWGRRVALPSKSSCEDLLAEVGVTVEHAAEEHWEAIPKSEWTRGEGLRHRVIRFARNVVVGVIPLLVVLVAPVLGFSIPLSVRDPLLTFAVPWILLQVLEFIVPNASGYLSRSKDIRELLSAPIAKAIA